MNDQPQKHPSVSRFEAYVVRREQIKMLRESKKLTQEELANKAGISRVFIGQIESGQANPSVDTLISLSESLGYGFEINFSSNKPD